jgi:iron complex transport system permease protein
VHVTGGAADLTPSQLLGALGGLSGFDGLSGLGAVGADDLRAAEVLLGSRIPRLLAGLVAGAALAVSGALLQAVTRNPLAAPETLGVNAGAWLGVVGVTALGVSAPGLPQGAAAFGGGLLAAAWSRCSPAAHVRPPPGSCSPASR